MTFKLNMGFLLVAVLKVSVVDNSKIKSPRSAPHANLNDLLKNITRVNSIMEELGVRLDKALPVNDDEKNNMTYSADEKYIVRLTNNDVKEKDNTKYRKKSRKLKDTRLYKSIESSDERETYTNEKKREENRRHNNKRDSENYENKAMVVKDTFEDKTELNSSFHKIKRSQDKNKNLSDKEEEFSIILVKVKRNRSNRSKHRSINKISEAPNKKNIARSPDSYSEEDKMMRKDILRAKKLKKEYDNACTMVVVLKCTKALKAVSKDVCSSGKGKCRKKFQEDFKKNSKMACDAHFNEPSPCRSGFDYLEIGDFSNSSSVTSNNTNLASQNKISKIKHDFDNLEGMASEKDCMQENYKKCLEAGKYATQETCKEHACVSQKEKTIQNSCRRRCSQNFGIDIDESGKSDSDSDTDSDSDDDSKSDTDSDDDSKSDSD